MPIPIALLTLFASRTAQTPADPYLPPPVVCRVETEGGNYTPDQVAKLTEIGKQYATVATANYGMIVRVLGAEHNFRCAKFTIVVAPKYSGVAGTANDETGVSASYALAHPDDLGMIVHELAHVVQHYGSRGSAETPGWLVEGIADYVRWFNYEPVNRRPHPRASRASATGSYQTSAAFLDWAVRKYDRDLVKQLNQAAYDGAYDPGIWVRLTGKSLGQLDTEWVASLSR